MPKQTIEKENSTPHPIFCPPPENPGRRTCRTQNIRRNNKKETRPKGKFQGRKIYEKTELYPVYLPNFTRQLI